MLHETAKDGKMPCFYNHRDSTSDDGLPSIYHIGILKTLVIAKNLRPRRHGNQYKVYGYHQCILFRLIYSWRGRIKSSDVGSETATDTPHTLERIMMMERGRSLGRK